MAGCDEHTVAALPAGGMLIVSDVFTDPGGCNPPMAALFGLNMLLTAPGGGVHEATAVARWMDEAGLEGVEVRPFPPPLPHQVVVGCKPPGGTP